MKTHGRGRLVIISHLTAYRSTGEGTDHRWRREISRP